MPPLTAHIHFASMLLPRLGPRYDALWFLLGSVAPDCFDRASQESWASSHFVGSASRPDTNLFLSKSKPGLQDAASAAVFAGYFAHLWLDERFSPGGVELPIQIPAGASAGSIRGLVQSQTRRYDLIETRQFLSAYVGRLQEASHGPLPKALTDCPLYSHSEASDLLAKVIEASQAKIAAEASPLVIDRRAYSSMLSNLADLCAQDLMNAGIVPVAKSC